MRHVFKNGNIISFFYQKIKRNSISLLMPNNEVVRLVKNLKYNKFKVYLRKNTMKFYCYLKMYQVLNILNVTLNMRFRY